MMGTFITLLISQNLFAKTFGGTSPDYAYSIIQTADEGYVVLGETWSFGVGNCDFLVIKLNPNGSAKWARTYGGTDMDKPHSIIQTADGGYVVVGETYNSGTGHVDLLVFKLDSDGSLVWNKRYCGLFTDFAYSIIQTSDGGYALAGKAWRSYRADSVDCLVLKLNSDGSVAWARTYGQLSNNEVAYSIIQTSDGGYVVAGETRGFNSFSDLLVLKLNSDGSVAWAKVLHKDYWDEAHSVIQTADGGYVVAGSACGVGDWNFLVLKLNNNGSLVWAKTFDGGKDDYLYSLTQTADGGYVAAGYTCSFGASIADFFVLKMDTDGSITWARTYGGTKYDEAYSITQTLDGGYAIAGTTQSFGDGYSNLLVLKLDQNGNYPGCVLECSPTVNTTSISSSSLSVGTYYSITTTLSPSPTITTPSLTTIDVCPPAVEETDLSGPKPAITCSPLFGGVMFIAYEDTYIRIYSVEGRLAYSAVLKKGENLIGLGRGVYIWMAGIYKGKVAVR